MPLSEYVQETETIKLGKTTFTVHGLGAQDFASMMRVHADTMRDLGVELTVMHKAGTLNASSGILAMMSSAPIIVAHVIQLATGEHDVPLEHIMKIPAPTQIDALNKILRLTWEDVGGPKALAEIVRDLVENARKSGLKIPTKSP